MELGVWPGPKWPRNWGPCFISVLSTLHKDKPGVQRWGKYALLIGYFVPGVRHLVALLAGASNLPLHVFARFAYCGAFLWSATFITAGYGLGEEWERLSPLVHRTVVILAVAVGLQFSSGCSLCGGEVNRVFRSDDVQWDVSPACRERPRQYSDSLCGVRRNEIDWAK